MGVYGVPQIVSWRSSVYFGGMKGNKEFDNHKVGTTKDFPQHLVGFHQIIDEASPLIMIHKETKFCKTLRLSLFHNFFMDAIVFPSTDTCLM